ncbi:MAG: DnaA regulatory inactivator Hda [Gammaproteobacteria bacterium]|nr:MAG: DnaA regulatory inactivator Hda [Gammaproteobacteria bacterium]
MQQLPLAVGPPDHAVFESFLPGPNAALLHALQEIARVRSRALLWLWGPPGSGRSHLLQATVAEAAARGDRGACLPLSPDAGLAPEALAGMEALDLVCLDDLDCVAGDLQWERALFALYEALRERSARLVVAATAAPLHLSFGLPDLVSRFSAAATFRMRPLSDDDKLAALQLRSAWRGMELPAETAAYLLSRVPRDSRSLFALLDRLDRAALAAQKRLTIPFVRRLLAEEPGLSPED